MGSKIKLFFSLVIIIYGSNIFSISKVEKEFDFSKINRNYFIENKGQWERDVLFLCRMANLDIWITKYGINYTFYETQDLSVLKSDLHEKKLFYNSEKENKTGKLYGQRVLLKYNNHNPNPLTLGLEKQACYYNYFIGNNPINHVNNVSLYKEIVIQNIYPGIDIRYYFDRSFLRYDFIVHPGANPDLINFELIGDNGSSCTLNKISFKTRFGEVLLTELKSTQENKEVRSCFLKKNDKWQIKTGLYDSKKELIIDPLIYSTYIGGALNEYGNGIVCDNSGNAYITGSTNSLNYDITPGVFQITNNGGTNDAFVSKINSLGSGLIYSTYFGGSGSDVGNDIVIDLNNNAYITGWTNSLNFSTTPGVFQPTLSDTISDVFVVKINSTGTTLIYSTFIGGTGNDYGVKLTADSIGNAYLTGATNSTDYDITSGAYQTVNDGYYEAFISILNAFGTGLLYSSYLGGSNNDYGYAIAIDSIGSVFITGLTNSIDFDITNGNAYDVTYNGLGDVFVTKLNATNNSLVYSTFIGGSDIECGNGIAIDNIGNAYITGTTYSTNYDLVANAFQVVNVNAGGFVTKLNANGSVLIYSTLIGGNGNDMSNDIVIDLLGRAIITGTTSSGNFITTSDAIQVNFEGGTSDIFVAVINNTGSSLLYSTYLGGSGYDIATKVALDLNGGVYIVGSTYSIDFDVTNGAFQTTTFSNVPDVFVSKLDLSTVSTNSISGISDIKIYPNPTSNSLNLSNLSINSKLTMIDINGKIVIEAIIINDNNISLEMSDYVNGIYFIKIENQDKVSVYKVINNK